MADRARKVKPIYEAIDVHNFRGALKLCAKRDLEGMPLVKVSCISRPLWPLWFAAVDPSVSITCAFQALKAYCLVKLGADGEALEICDDLVVRMAANDWL